MANSTRIVTQRQQGQMHDRSNLQFAIPETIRRRRRRSLDIRLFQRRRSQEEIDRKKGKSGRRILPDDPDDGADDGDEEGEQGEGKAEEPPERPALAVAIAAHLLYCLILIRRSEVEG
ncbi:hypothetical protein Cni_G29257 [Canna indica]|uniref:Uncharacterized protein n=1 Tax=Canna indica TaxID=4628 RepID=A0AAQ3L6W8_9LILI|nr:hypothetical protein Cni_G29257 [Canna indica]